MHDGRRGAASIVDVARRAGVSPKTVSRVVNGDAHVSERTLRRVRQAIQELGYVRNVSAARLRAKRSFEVALVYYRGFPLFGWVGDIISSAVRAATTRGYEVITHPSDLPGQQSKEQLLKLVDERRVEGLIFLPPFGGFDEITDALAHGTAPYVAIQPPNSDVPWPSVSHEYRKCAAEMTHYLIDMGHRRIGFIQGSPSIPSTFERLAGYRAALQERGIAYDPALVRSGEFNFETGVVFGRQLLTMKQRPTAIFGCNDEIAAGVIQAAYRIGLRMPDDLSVAGYDDADWARMLTPALTTISQSAAQTALEATELLLNLIGGNQEETADLPVRRQLPGKLLVRESTGPAPLEPNDGMPTVSDKKAQPRRGHKGRKPGCGAGTPAETVTS